MDPSTQAPDLQAATGQTPPVPMTGPSVLAALGALQGPAPGLAAGSGMLSALAGRPGANPYLQQHAVSQQGSLDQINSLRVAQQHDQSAQLQMQMLQERMQEHIARRLDRQQATLRTILDGMTNSDDERARAFGWMQKGKLLEQGGMPVPQSVIGGLARGKLKKEDLEGAILASDELTPDQIGRLYPNLSAEQIQYAGQLSHSPIVRHKLGLLSDEDIQIKKAQAKINAAKAVEAEHPELRGKSSDIAGILMKHRELFDGRDYLRDGDEQSQQRAYAAWKRDEQQRAEDLLRLQGRTQDDAMARIAAQGNNQLAAIMARTQQPKPLNGAEMTRAQKVVEQYSKADNVLKSLQNIDSLTDEMSTLGALPEKEDVASQWLAKVNRTATLRGNQAVFQFQQLWGPVSIGQIDRGMFDEKGVRAISAFTKQLDAIDNMPPAKAIKAYTEVVKKQILRKMAGDIDILQQLGERSEIVDAAKSIYGKWEPTDRAAKPTRALTITDDQRNMLLKKGYTIQDIEKAYGR